MQGGDAAARDALFAAAYAELGKKGVVLDVDTLVTPMDVLSGGRRTGEETWGYTDSGAACRTSPKAAVRERRVRVTKRPSSLRASWLALRYGSQAMEHERQFDPSTGNPEIRAVLWRNGKIQDLGTLDGTASLAGGTFAGVTRALLCSTLATAVRPTGFRSTRRQQNQTVAMRPCSRDSRHIAQAQPLQGECRRFDPVSTHHFGRPARFLAPFF